MSETNPEADTLIDHLFAQFREAIQTKDCVKALGFIQQIFAQADAERHFHRAYEDLGFIYIIQHRYEEALVAFQRSTTLYPTCLHTWYRLADVYIHLQRWAEAVAAYQHALLFYKLGMVNPQTREQIAPTLAIHIEVGTTDIHEVLVECYYNLTCAYAHLQRIADARQSFMFLVAIDYQAARACAQDPDTAALQTDPEFRVSLDAISAQGRDHILGHPPLDLLTRPLDPEPLGRV